MGKKARSVGLENCFDGEVREMVELYMERGMKKDDANEVVSRMAKYKDFFVDLMMLEELGMLRPECTPHVNSQSVTTNLAAYILPGVIPALFYFALGNKGGLLLPCTATIAAGASQVALLEVLSVATPPTKSMRIYSAISAGATTLLIGTACFALARGAARCIVSSN